MACVCSQVFLAALLAEPSRWTVAHITNILLLNTDSTLNDQSTPPKRHYTKAEQRKIDSGTYVSSGVNEHFSMTQSGSDPYKKTGKGLIKDGDVETAENVHLPKNVTDRDFEAIKHNASLVNELELYTPKK